MKAPKTKTPKTKPEPKTKRTRPASAALTICRSKGGTVLALVKQADSEYVKQGGKANKRESAWSVGRAVGIMEALGLVRVDDGKVAVVGKVVSR